MKKLILFLTIGLLTLSGCAAQPNIGDDMYVTLSELTDSEKDLVNLTNYSDNIALFDYKVNDTIKAMQIDQYKLAEDGSWQFEEGSYRNSIDQSSNEGRLAILRNKSNQSLSISTLTSNGTTGWSNNKNDTYGEFTAFHSTTLTQPHSIILGEEVPLIIEIYSNETNEEHSVSIDNYYNTSSLIDSVKEGSTILATVAIFDDNVE